MSKKQSKKTTSVTKYKKQKEVELDTDSEEEEENKKKVKKKVTIDKKINIDSDDDLKLECVKCKKNIDLDKQVVYDYCEDCNTLIHQCSLKDLMSVLTALNSQIKILYNENNFLIEKIKMYETPIQKQNNST